MPWLIGLLSFVFIAGCAEAGTHIMFSDILPGGATSYINNGTSAQTATLNITDSAIGTASTISESLSSGLNSTAENMTHTCSAGLFNGFGLKINQSGGCLLSSESLLISNSATSPSNAGLDIQVSGASSSNSFAINASASGASTANYGFKSTAANGVTNYGLWTSGNGGTNNYAIWADTGTSAFNWTVRLPTITSANLGVRVPDSTREIWYCSDCTNALTCISTGTAKGAFASQQATNRTTACN